MRKAFEIYKLCFRLYKWYDDYRSENEGKPIRLVEYEQLLQWIKSHSGQQIADYYLG